MSPRALFWLLWLAALVALPLPLVGIGSALVPPLHQLELGLLALAFTVTERAQGIGPLASVLFLGQAFAYALALALAARLLARLLGHLGPLTRTRVAFFFVVLGVTIAVSVPVYRTPYSAHSTRSNLLGVYR